MVPSSTEPRRGMTTRLKMWGRGARGSMNNTLLIRLAMTTLLTASRRQGRGGEVCNKSFFFKERVDRAAIHGNKGRLDTRRRQSPRFVTLPAFRRSAKGQYYNSTISIQFPNK